MLELKHNIIEAMLSVLTGNALTPNEWMKASFEKGVLYHDFLITARALKEAGIVNATVINDHITSYRMNQ